MMEIVDELDDWVSVNQGAEWNESIEQRRRWASVVEAWGHSDARLIATRTQHPQ